MRKKYRSKKAWDKKSLNHSGSQQKVWHYLWFLLTFGKNSLIHYGRWIQQEGLVFNHQNTSATPFWPSQCHTAKKEGKQALQIGVKLWSCRFVGMLPYWDFCFKNLSARSDFSLLHFSEVVVTLKFPWFVDLLSTWRSRPRVISARLLRESSPESGKTVIMH